MGDKPALGRVDNLTTTEQAKLQQAWLRLGEICDITPDGRQHDSASEICPPASDNPKDDKYGQVREFQQYLADSSPEDIRASIWSMVKMDHPDSLILRFLRARKWDVDKAIIMLVSTVQWRKKMHLEDSIVREGEAVALKKDQTKEDADFIQQYRSGKCFLRGVDRQSRPVCIIKVRLHNANKQSATAMECYTLHVIESIRMLLRQPVDTASCIFDLTGFGMRNMDTATVRFIIKVFEANYPESLGEVSVHNAPWIFQGLWRMIKGWLDPVVAAKIRFTNTSEDLLQMIPPENLPVEYGGTDQWEYVYKEPQAGENRALTDTLGRERVEAERAKIVHSYEQRTLEWVKRDVTEHHAKELFEERNKLAEELRVNYWQLDPYIRARTLYDRTGYLEQDGTVNFNPAA